MLKTNEKRTIRFVPTKPVKPHNPPLSEGIDNSVPVDSEIMIAKVGQVVPPPKPWYKSKTLWFNGIAGVVGVVASVTPYLQPFIDAQTFGMVTAGIAVANTVLRAVTKQPIRKLKRIGYER